MDILGQSALFVGLISFALGFSVLARNAKNKLFLAFAVLTTVISAWAICFFFEKIWPGGTFYRWHTLFGIWLGPAGLGFVRVMVRIPDRFNDRLSRRLLDFSVVASALADGDPRHAPQVAAGGVLPAMYFSPALVVLQIFQLMWIDRRLAPRISSDYPKSPPWAFFAATSSI